MPIADILAELRAEATECTDLIATAHRTGPDTLALFTQSEQRRITICAFLNLFVAWETFTEQSLVSFMIGDSAISGRFPTRFVTPATRESALAILMGNNRYFDFANHEHVGKIAGIYFQDGYPFQPHLRSIATDLADLRMMRNASAHISTSTQTALESLGQRILGTPRKNIQLYDLLVAPDPRARGVETVVGTSRDKLLAAAQLIATG